MNFIDIRDVAGRGVELHKKTPGSSLWEGCVPALSIFLAAAICQLFYGIL